MNGQRLRSALEKLVQRNNYPDGHVMTSALESLLAKHPAEPVGVSDALAQQVRNMHAQIVDLMKQIRERDDAMGEMREHLADLTSYCLGRAECGDVLPDEKAVYEDVARHLNEIRQGDTPTVSDYLTSLGLARSEIRDEVDELIRNAYAEGWREAKQRPDTEPPVLVIDWGQPGGVRITELWCVCDVQGSPLNASCKVHGSAS